MFAARNLVAYLSEQHSATGTLPNDRTIVFERFRDELGDWRLCILSPFGKPVHAPWAMAIEEKLSADYGLERIEGHVYVGIPSSNPGLLRLWRSTMTGTYATSTAKPSAAHLFISDLGYLPTLASYGSGSP